MAKDNELSTMPAIGVKANLHYSGTNCRSSRETFLPPALSAHGPAPLTRLPAAPQLPWRRISGGGARAHFTLRTCPANIFPKPGCFPSGILPQTRDSSQGGAHETLADTLHRSLGDTPSRHQHPIPPHSGQGKPAHFMPLRLGAEGPRDQLLASGSKEPQSLLPCRGHLASACFRWHSQKMAPIVLGPWWPCGHSLYPECRIRGMRVAQHWC